MKEDFTKNIHFDLFSVELVVGETATLLLAENYVTIREVFVDDVKVEPNEEKANILNKRRWWRFPLGSRRWRYTTTQRR